MEFIAGHALCFADLRDPNEILSRQQVGPPLSLDGAGPLEPLLLDGGHDVREVWLKGVAELEAGLEQGCLALLVKVGDDGAVVVCAELLHLLLSHPRHLRVLSVELLDHGRAPVGSKLNIMTEPFQHLQHHVQYIEMSDIVLQLSIINLDSWQQLLTFPTSPSAPSRSPS